MFIRRTRWRRMIMERVQQLQHLERDDLWVLTWSLLVVVVDLLVLAVHVVHLPHFILRDKQCDQFRTCRLQLCLLVDLLYTVRANRLVSHSQRVMMWWMSSLSVLWLMDVLTQQRRIWTCDSEDRVSSCGFFFPVHSFKSALRGSCQIFFFFFYQENVALLTDLVTSCYSDCHSSFPPRAVKTTQFQICWKNTNKHMMIWQNMRPIELIRNQGDRFLLCEMSPQSHNYHMISQSSCVSFPQSLVTLQSRLKKVSQSPFHDQYKVSVYTDTS